MPARPVRPATPPRTLAPPGTRQAGFTLIEVLIVLAISLVTGAIIYKVSRASMLLYNTQTHVTERGFSGLRAVDDMAVEIARAGYGLGADAAPVFPGNLDGVRSPNAITLRSNPGGVAGVLRENLKQKDTLVVVEEAPLFAVGDDVLLIDEEGTIEHAQVTKTALDALAFRSTTGPDGQMENAFLTSLDARVLRVREVAFYLRTDAAGTVVLARKATGQAEQILARYVDALGFAYLDDAGGLMDPKGIGPGTVPGAVRISLALLPNPALPPIVVPPLSLRVSLETQSATVAFDTFAFHRVGVAGVIGRGATPASLKIGMHGWRKSDPRY
jgi:prepilin-type N-terminal cleavage/methylation domain-containing protein